VAAQVLSSGGVLIEVSDSGVGIPEARLAEMNWRLDNPPVMDVQVSRHMGLFAVARLAERHGIRVRLRPRAPHGLTALVWLPDSVTERETGLYGSRSRTFAAQAGSPGRGKDGLPTRQVPEAQPANHRRDVIVPEHAGNGARETVTSGTGMSGTGMSGTGMSGTGMSGTGSAAAAATSDWFRSRPSSPAGTNGNTNGGGTATAAAAQPEVRRPSGTDEWMVGRHAAQIIAEPVRGDFTAAGLPTRIPQANLIPGSAGGGRAPGGGTSRPGPGHETQAPTTPRSPRSPDVARNRLSGFQRGVRRAKGPSPSAPDSGEGTE